MEIKYVLKIDDYIVPNVTKCKAYRNDTDSDATGRNALAEMIRYRVGRIPKIEIEVGNLFQEDMQRLLEKLSLVEFNVEWFDPETGGYKKGKYYAGPHEPEINTIKPLSYKPMSFNVIGYKGDNGYVPS